MTKKKVKKLIKKNKIWEKSEKIISKSKEKKAQMWEKSEKRSGKERASPTYSNWWLVQYCEKLCWLSSGNSLKILQYKSMEISCILHNFY